MNQGQFGEIIFILMIVILQKAAVIEGLCKIGEEKEVSIKMIEPLNSYGSCFKNGVSSSSWGYWHGSYIFV